MRAIERVRPEDPGKVNQSVDRPLHARERRRACIGRFQRRDGGAHACAARELGGGCLEGRSARIDQQQLGALCEQQLRGLARNAAGASGDHDQPVLEFHAPPPVAVATVEAAPAAVKGAPRPRQRCGQGRFPENAAERRPHAPGEHAMTGFMLAPATRAPASEKVE
jgi:hypothetical protein